MSRAYLCEFCDREPSWTIERKGDAVVTWADDIHLADVCARLQRSFEKTDLSVRAFVRPRSWATPL